jgi:hypothetical protein
MQSHRSAKYKTSLKSRCWELGCLLLALGCSVPQARAQFALNRETGARTTVAGLVMIDGEAQPAARVRVDVKAITGGGIATTFTDSAGRFEAPASGSDISRRLRMLSQITMRLITRLVWLTWSCAAGMRQSKLCRGR